MRDRLEALAPAGVGLALFVVLAQIRMDGPWSSGALLACAAVPAALLAAAGLAAPRRGGAPTPGATALLVAGLLLTGIALLRLGQVLAGHDFAEHGGSLTLVLAAGTAIAGFCAARARSSACLLIAAVVAVGTLLSAVHWVSGTEDVDVYRALLAASFAVLFVAGLLAPGRAGTMLVSAAGVTVLSSGWVFGLGVFAFGGVGQPWGWELVILAEGVALAAYALVRPERGPGYLAFFVLGQFALTAALVGDEGEAIGEGGPTAVEHSLAGWPLALAIATVLAAAYALRPRPAQ